MKPRGYVPSVQFAARGDTTGIPVTFRGERRELRAARTNAAARRSLQPSLVETVVFQFA
jgi:hypothetical protein